MSKVTKGFIIGACVCIMLGIMIVIATVAAGGVGVTKNYIENGNGTILGLDNGFSVISWDDHDDIFGDDFFDDDHEIITKDTTEHTDMNQVDNLDMEIGGIRNIVLKETQGNDIVVNTEDIRKAQIYVEGNTLYVKATNPSTNSLRGKLTVEVPENMQFNDVELEVGAGSMEIETLYGNKFSVEVGAGKIEIDELYFTENEFEIGAGGIIVNKATLENANVEVGMGSFEFNGEVTGNMDAECGMGNIDFKGDIKGNLDASCDMGNLSLSLDGEEKDHNYDIDCSLGNINIGNRNYSSVAANSNLDNGATSDFYLECSMGNIFVTFRK